MEADRHFWATLLSRKVMLGSVSFAGTRNTKIVLNLPDSVPEWKLQFFYAPFEEGRGRSTLGAARSGEHPKKRKRVLSMEPMILSKEAQEALARWEEEDLRMGLALSCEEARRFGLSITLLEALGEPLPVEPAPSELVPLPIPAEETEESVGANAARVPGFASRLEVNSNGVGAPVDLGVLGSIFGEASSCLSNEQIFRWPFDMEARVMKILGDLLPIKSRAIRECHALSLAPTLNGEGREPGERMLLDYLPHMWKELSKLEERICLLNGCSSQEEYWSSSMEEDERQKIIAVRKRPKEAAVEQTSREVLRPNGHVPSEWELLKETCAKVWCMVRKRLEAERERCRTEDTTRAKLEVARDDAEGISLLKKDLDSALAITEKEAGDLCLQKFNIEASLQRLSSQAEKAREDVSRLLSEVDALRADRDEAIRKATAAEERVLQLSVELTAPSPGVMSLCARNPSLDTSEGLPLGGEALVLQEQVASLSSKESELPAEFELMQAEVAWLRTELDVLRAECFQVGSARGGNSFLTGSTSGTTASVIT
ncbi:hypothetical protein ACLOJK_034850 [Asimina triloba]